MAKTYKTAIALLFASPLLLSGAALARGASPYAKCAEITDDTARLACFDETFASETRRLADQAQTEREEIVENFGLSSSQIREREEAQEGAGSATGLEEEGQILTTVVGVFVNDRSGKRIFTLENGQIWAETQVSRMRRNPREGQQVTISKASLGRFQLRVEDKRGVIDVRRMR